MLIRVWAVDTWLGGVCTQTCSPAVLANASAAIERAVARRTWRAGRSSLFVPFFRPSQLATDEWETRQTALDFIVGNYTELKGVLCLQATSNSTYCLTKFVPLSCANRRATHPSFAAS